MPSGVKFITKQQVFSHCTLTHMTDLMTYPYTTIHRGGFRHGAHGDPRLRRQEDRDHAGRAAIDNEAAGGFFEQ